MPSKDPEPRRRRRSYDRDARGSPRQARSKDERDPPPRLSRSARSKVSSTSSKDKERSTDRRVPSTPRQALSSSSSSSLPAKPKRVTIIPPDMDRKGSNVSTSSPRANIPYPSFSKAHSREAVRSRESVSSNPLTPQHTDVGSNHGSSAALPRKNSKDATAAAPPSPPTTVGPDLRRATSGSSVRRKASEKVNADASHERSTSDDLATRLKQKHFTASSSSLRNAEEGVHKHSPRASPTKHGSTLRPESPVIRNKRSVESQPKTSRISSQSTIRGSRGDGSHPRASEFSGSEATFVRSDRGHARKVPTLDSQGSSPISDTESTPRTPKTGSAGFSAVNGQKQRGAPGPGIEVLYSDDGTESDGEATAEPAAPPPPPPPPNVIPSDLPQVDYLLENGGLQNLIPKVFASAAHPAPTQRYSQYMSPQVQQFSKSDHVQATFHPYSKLLDNYTQVLAKKGSLAVATGYKSVAKRLLSRLEETFARDVSSEKCPCVMCKSQASQASEDSQGSSWADVLELVSQRRQLPAWPPFHLQSSGEGLGIEDFEFEAPMQKLDIDVPEEYREHYLRQSKKTKQSVQKWLATQPEEEVSPPTDVDNETLTFAMLTYLEPDQRRIFTALMRGLSKVPDSRTPTPAPAEQKHDFMPKVGIAIQRLYRLSKPPREPEIAMFLLKNPELHSALMTLASVNQKEWDVILSGRFDGFLPGGEEEIFGSTPSRGPNAGPLSRNGTPFSAAGGVPVSRGTTPLRNGTPNPSGSASNPVAYDEETEIAVLAEVEREIYLGMEALEDAFEQLHVKAEGVRRALRERSAGLSMLAQTRRGSEVEVRMSTPGPGPGGWNQASRPMSFTDVSGDSETDDGMGDIKSELAPDDSASNIGFREHGRRRERNKRREKEAVRRRTPAVAEEVEPEDDRRSRRRR